MTNRIKIPAGVQTVDRPALFAVRMPGGSLGTRAIPTMKAAKRIAKQDGGRAVVDPRSRR